MADFLWFVAVAIGPILLGALFAYALLRRRRLRPDERSAQIRGTEQTYNDRRG